MSSFTTPRAPIARTRKRAAVLTLVLTAGLVGLASLAAWNPREYVALGSGTYWMAAVATLLPMAAGVTAVFLLRHRGAAVGAGVAGGVLTLIAACGGGAVALWTGPSWDRTVLATSPAGTYQVVSLTDDSITSRRELRIARPDGLLTREAARPVVCISASFGDHPHITVTSARFVAEHEVEVTLGDGRTWRTPFDPDDLRPAQTLADNCLYNTDNVQHVS